MLGTNKQLTFNPTFQKNKISFPGKLKEIERLMTL